MSIKVEVDLEIPRGVLTYDIGPEAFHCAVCGKDRPLKVIDGDHHLMGSPSVSHQFRDFVADHAACVRKHRDEKIRNAALHPEPERTDW